jgi:hypothetical protein
MSILSIDTLLRQRIPRLGKEKETREIKRRSE